MRQRHRYGGCRGIVGEGQRRAAGEPGGIGLAGGDGLAALRQAGRRERPHPAGIGGRGAEHGRAFAQRHRCIGIGGAGQGIVGGDVVGAAGVVRQRHRYGGRRGIVGEGQRRAAGEPGGIGLAGGDGLAALRQAGRGERPHAAGIGGRGAEHRRAFAQRHRCIGIGGAGQGIVGGDVVGAAGVVRQARPLRWAPWCRR